MTTINHELIRACQEEEKRFQKDIDEQSSGVPIEAMDTVLHLVHEEHRKRLQEIFKNNPPAQ